MRFHSPFHKGAADYEVSLGYLTGQIGRKDLRASFRWNQRSARTGYHDAQLAMGWFFHNGVGVRQDLEKARTWYEIAARRRDPRAWFSLGQLAFDQREFVEALSWF